MIQTYSSLLKMKERCSEAALCGVAIIGVSAKHRGQKSSGENVLGGKSGGGECPGWGGGSSAGKCRRAKES